MFSYLVNNKKGSRRGGSLLNFICLLFIVAA